MIKIGLDNGHGIETSGKRSPDGSFREYKWTREFVSMLQNLLIENGYEVVLLTPEEIDIPIKTRAKRANNALVDLTISIHNNAQSDNWSNANGISVHLDKASSSSSKRYADIFIKVFQEAGYNTRIYAPYQKYWIQSLGICRMTTKPCILVENFFMTNKEDLKKLTDKSFCKELANNYLKALNICFNK